MSTEPDPFDFPEVQKKAEIAEELKQESEREAVAELVRWHKEIGQSFIQADEEPREVDWMVDGFITFDGITLFSAKSKAGKSFMTYDLAIAGATGTGSIRTPEGGWLFDFKGKAVKTYYLDTENSKSNVIRRLESLANEKGVSRKDLIASGQLVVNCLEVQQVAPFLDPKRDSIDDDVRRAKEWGELLGRAGFRFIILDVLSHCYQKAEPGQDENDRAFIADFYKVANAIRAGANACLLIVHHHKKGNEGQGNEMASGSGMLLRTPTTLISLGKVKDSDNPEGDLYQITIEGRETKGAQKTLKARGTADGRGRAFDQVEIVNEPKEKGAPRTAEKTAIEILDAVLLKEPEMKGAMITKTDWFRLAERVSSEIPGARKGADTLEGYLKKVLVKAGRVKYVSPGVYQIL
jgi:hypothetical protein